MTGLETSGTAIDEHSFVVVFGMETLALLEHYKGSSDRDCRYEGYQPRHETDDDIHDDESHNRSTGCCGCPIDVAALKSHQFEGSLQPLEHWIGRIAFFIGIRHDLHTEEERQSLCCGHEEDAGADNHHDRLLENLLPNCKVLNINTPKKQKVPKETNWKQKFQKPQNENICLTYLNTEMNGNFHFLSFCAAFLKVQNQVL